MQKIQKFEEAVRRLDPDFTQHLVGGVLAVVTGIGVLAMVVAGMTTGLPFPAPVL